MTNEVSLNDPHGDDTSQSNRLLRIGLIVPGSIIFLIIAAALLVFAPRLLLNNWLGDQKVDPATVRLAVGNAAQVVLFALGGLIALVGVVLSLSRHGLELETARSETKKEARRILELQQQRSTDSERELRTRFVNAVSLLSDRETSTTREAGVYALAALADDWHAFGRPDERQVCIDVLCSYLRSNWDPAADTAENEKNIRAAGFDVIGAHLRVGSSRSTWRGTRINLRGALVDFDTNLSEIDTSETTIDFTGTTFAGGETDFSQARFANSMSFTGARFSGAQLSFHAARFERGMIDFEYAVLEAGRVPFSRASFEGGDVSFADAKFKGTAVMFSGSKMRAGTISFAGAEFAHGRVNFMETQFAGATVDFESVRFSGASVNFSRARFSDGIVRFEGAERSGGSVRFARATFSGTMDGEGGGFIEPLLTP